MNNADNPKFVGLGVEDVSQVVSGDGSSTLEVKLGFFGNDTELIGLVAQALGEAAEEVGFEVSGGRSGRKTHGWTPSYGAGYERIFGNKPDNPNLN
jgi:hypothetical protein